MDGKDLFKDAQYKGSADGERRTYYAYETTKNFLLASPSSSNQFNVTVIDKEATSIVAKKFAGKRVTAREVNKSSRKDLFGAPFSALNTLYIMVALGHARRLKRRIGKAFVFKIRPS